MKKFRFCALCLILAALLSACGRQAAQDVPGAAAVPSPAAVPEAPAESTSTPSPTAPAEIGKEFDDLSFLNEEQRQALLELEIPVEDGVNSNRFLTSEIKRITL